MTQATPNPPRDTRPTVAGFVLPWDVVVPNDTGFLDVVDAEGAHVTTIDGSDRFWTNLISDVNRMGEVQAYLSGLTSLTIKRHPLKLEPGFVDPEKEKQAFQNAQRMGFMEAGAPWEKVQAHNDPLARIAALESALVEVVQSFTRASRSRSGRQRAKVILDRVGLAHRLQGNPGEAEQVTA